MSGGRPRKDGSSPWQTVLGIAAVVAGLALAAFEALALSRAGPAEGWFWLGAAILLVVLGLFGLVGGKPRN